MKKSLVVRPSALQSLAALSPSEKAACFDAITKTMESFGQPHVHSGAGIRKLGRNLFECRAGLKLRLLFIEEPHALDFFFAGNHDEVQALLRSRR